MARCRGAVLGLLLGTLTIVVWTPRSFAQESSASAEEPDKSKEAMSDVARELYEEGDRFLRKGDYHQACARLTAAYRIMQHYQIAAALGLCELRLGNHRIAAELVTVYLDEAPADEPAELREKAGKLLAEATANLATVTLSVSLPEARVTVDEQEIKKGATTIYLEPGTHIFVARHEGYDTVTKSHDLVAGSTQTVNLLLTPKALAAVAPAPTDGQGDVDDGVPFAPPWLAAPIAVSTIGSVVGLGLHAHAFDLNHTADELLHQHWVQQGNTPCDASTEPADVAVCTELGDTVEELRATEAASFWMFTAGGAGTLATGGMMIAYFMSDEAEAGPFDPKWFAVPLGVGALSLALAIGFQRHAIGVDGDAVSVLHGVRVRTGADACAAGATIPESDVAECAEWNQLLSEHEDYISASSAMASIAIASSLATGGLAAYYFANSEPVERAEEPSSTFMVLPHFSPNVQGVSLVGSW